MLPGVPKRSSAEVVGVALRPDDGLPLPRHVSGQSSTACWRVRAKTASRSRTGCERARPSHSSGADGAGPRRSEHGAVAMPLKPDTKHWTPTGAAHAGSRSVPARVESRQLYARCRPRPPQPGELRKAHHVDQHSPTGHVNHQRSKSTPLKLQEPALPVVHARSPLYGKLQ